jgi:hypothetical protein
MQFLVLVTPQRSSQNAGHRIEEYELVRTLGQKGRAWYIKSSKNVINQLPLQASIQTSIATCNWQLMRQTGAAGYAFLNDVKWHNYCVQLPLT